MSELGQQTVDFSSLVSRAAEDSFIALKELVEKSKSTEQSDSERKINLLKYLVKTQQRMLRLNILAKWCQQVPLIQYCQQVASTLSSHDNCFTQAADSLYFMHEGLQQACAPIYDVPSAIEVLLTGNYQRIPKCIEVVGMQNALTVNQQKPVLKKLDMLVRSKLLEVSLPKEISKVIVSDGTALLLVNGEFKILVTLGYRGHLSMWRVLHLELFVGEKNRPVKLEEMQRHILGDDLERRMAAVDNPFMTLYTVLHELCVVLIMDTVLRQVQTLTRGRWRDSIRFELISDGSGGQASNVNSIQSSQDGEADWSGLRIPGLKIVYWLDLDKKAASPDYGSCPFLKVEPGPDLQIKSLHSSFVVDPVTGKEAEFTLDMDCIDVEKLLLKAITCNRHTRLLEIQRQLNKNCQICRGTGDVILKCCMDDPHVAYKQNDCNTFNREYKGQEVLHVRAYNSSYFILCIDIRSGRFLLQSSKNIITPSALVNCEEALNQGSMTATEVFISLRSKSILHAFASVGRFLGLEVYEHGFSSLKLPKEILIVSSMLFMVFPDCKNSYFLLMQLDKDFKPLFNLLEAQGDPTSKDCSSIITSHVLRQKNVDIAEMNMLEDDLNLSILDFGKLYSALPDAVGLNQTSENGLLADFGLETPMQFAGCRSTTFSSVVDEVFELDKSASVFPNASSSFNVSNLSNIGSMFMNPDTIKTATPPKWDGSIQKSLINNVVRVSSGASSSSNLSSNLKGIPLSNSVSLLSSYSGSVASIKLSSSKSDQDLPSLKSPHSAEVVPCSSMDEDQTKLVKDCSKLVTKSFQSHFLSQPQITGSPTVASNSKPNVPITSTSGHASLKVSGSGMLDTTPVSQVLDSAICSELSLDNLGNRDKNPRKRSVSNMLNLIPSLQGHEANAGLIKRRKIANYGHEQRLLPSKAHKGIYSYGNLIDEANKGNAPSSIYVSSLLHVVRYCSLSIKHARLSSQMEALDIPYIEEVGVGNSSLNLGFRIPSAQGDSWPHLCLRLGRPGSTYWDVKINDQHFRDLWELQKGSNTTPWGSGVRIANTSDMDSHIRYDSDGVILCYYSVEDDSIKKLVADVQRLSNASMFALRMRNILGVRADEVPEECCLNFDRISEQTRKVFRIEAVGLMSLWFSFGSGVMTRFVVEWESCKEGCTMHVSPDQLWPHTKFLEDFINGGEVSSLLDCIRLTNGPLHALAAASRPARGGGSPPGGPSSVSSLSRQPGPTPNLSYPAPLGTTPPNPIPPAAASTNLGRGGPGLVPSSLLPIDVSVVLCGPYWIRIVYRKDFSVDMRCYAADQVWLQPATPPKRGPSIGGSLPCPHFRPFIMEHVAQELNVLDPNFANSSSGISGSASQQSGRVSRPGNQVGIRRSPSTGIPAHVRGEINTAIIGLGDDGGYGGGWVPVVALKKVLRGILKYLGVLWLFAQLPNLLRDILGSILKENEGALLNLDQEQPALRFFVGGYVFAVSVHRVQLLLQVISVKRFHNQQQLLLQQQLQLQQQQQLNPAGAPVQEELSKDEIGEICDYFSRRVATEPYDASRVASFITLITLPISVLREFLKLIAWKRGLFQQVGVNGEKPRIELCLENHGGRHKNSKSNIWYDRPHNRVEFGLTVVLDPALIPHVNIAGGAAWLPYCVSVRLRYGFGENPGVSFVRMEGSHGGRACWAAQEEWERCRQRVGQTLEMSAAAAGDGRLKAVADAVQKTLHLCLKGLKDGGISVIPTNS